VDAITRLPLTNPVRRSAHGDHGRGTVTASTVLPKTGQVNFYLLTSKGTLLYAAPEKLGDGNDKPYAGH